MLWNLWCERVRFLSPDDPGSSYSETSVASSESNSTIYLTASTKVAIPDLGVPQIWCQYKADKHRHEEIGTNRTPYGDMICHPKPGNSMTEVRMLYRKPQINKRCSNSCTSCTTSETPTLSEGSQLQLVNRFGCGIPENCITALYLPEEKYTVERKTNQHVSHVAESIELVTVYPPNHQLPSMSNLLEESISLWEKTKRQREVNNDKLRHPRYYGFSSHCLFLNGLGPWHVAPGEKHSIQAKGAVSSVTICRQPADSEMRLPVSKRQLSSSISCDALHMSNHCLSNSLKKPKPPSQSMVYFWTPKYWYRPISSKAAYRELNRHMKEIHRYHEQNAMIQGRQNIFYKYTMTGTENTTLNFFVICYLFCTPVYFMNRWYIPRI
ncbi:hypothetical protein C0J52_01875 [Blattella germanica]|nr:hypothetical protein C0J52_01875 [Blattella germanica]